MRQPSGFTLVELLVVIAVIAVLAAIGSTVLAHAERIGRITATQATCQKVETGLGLFRTEVGVYPYQAHGSGSDPFPAQDNNLYRRLAYDLASDAAAMTLLRADLQTAQAAYAPGGSHRSITLRPLIDTRNTDVITSTLLRIGQERARLAVLSGNAGYTGINAATAQVVPGFASDGWCGDYLGGELSQREHEPGGRAILDAYSRPLIYIAPLVPGMRSVLPATKVSNDGNNWSKASLDDVYYRFAAEGRALATSRTSDMRSTAAKSYLLMYELWSAGRDGRIAPLRSDAVNNDNIASRPYERELTP